MSTSPAIQEVTLPARSGMLLLVAIVLLNVGLLAWVIASAIVDSSVPVILLVALGVSLVALPFILPGFVVVGPNEGRALVLFGRYRGTIRESGFF